MVSEEAGYPGEPYGAQEGDRIPNFSFQGYRATTRTTGLASAEMFGEVTMDQLRQSGKRYALLQLAAFW